MFPYRKHLQAMGSLEKQWIVGASEAIRRHSQRPSATPSESDCQSLARAILPQPISLMFEVDAPAGLAESASLRCRVNNLTPPTISRLGRDPLRIRSMLRMSKP